MSPRPSRAGHWAGLLLEVTGCAHLLGGEPALLAGALGRLQRAGIAAHGAVAGAAATAAALVTGAPPGRSRSDAAQGGAHRP